MWIATMRDIEQNWDDLERTMNDKFVDVPITHSTDRNIKGWMRPNSRGIVEAAFNGGSVETCSFRASENPYLECLSDKNYRSMRINVKPNPIKKFENDKVKMAVYVRAVPKRFTNVRRGISSMRLAYEDSCPPDYVSCELGNSDPAFVTCALSADECPITNLRMDTSGSVCSALVIDDKETCLELT